MSFAAGRTSQHETEPVDLFAEASAAAWAEEPESSSAPGQAPQASTAPPGQAPRTNTAPGHASTQNHLQQNNAMLRSAAAGGSASATQQAQPARLVSAPQPQQPMPSAALPYTPPAQLQNQQAVGQSSLKHNRSTLGLDTSSGRQQSSSNTGGVQQTSSNAEGATRQLSSVRSRLGDFESMATQPYQAMGGIGIPQANNGRSPMQQSPQLQLDRQPLPNRQMPSR